MDVHDSELHSLYVWVDEIPLSRPKRNIARDFADGVLMAEIVHHYFSRLVELHNYSAAHGMAQKLYNWSTLNQRVFRRLGFVVAKIETEACASATPGAIERVLKLVRLRLSRFAEGPACPAEHALGNNVHDDHRDEVNSISLEGRTDAVEHTEPCDILGDGGDTACVADVMAAKDANIRQLKDANKALEEKVSNLERLVLLKDEEFRLLMDKFKRSLLALDALSAQQNAHTFNVDQHNLNQHEGL